MKLVTMLAASVYLGVPLNSPGPRSNSKASEGLRPFIVLRNLMRSSWPNVVWVEHPYFTATSGEKSTLSNPKPDKKDIIVFRDSHHGVALVTYRLFATPLYHKTADRWNGQA